MRELPHGTVTFLFTDIEGSTRLLRRLGPAYEALLTEHRSLLRAAFAEAGGAEVETRGDSFLVAFQSAHEAVNGAVAAQRALAAHTWPEGAEARVRMGMHTGEPVLATEGYIGLDVHRAARIGEAANGGQVLVSESTRALVGEEVVLRDLGEYGLAGLERPERLYQVVAPHVARAGAELASQLIALDRLPERRRAVEEQVARLENELGSLELRLQSAPRAGPAPALLEELQDLRNRLVSAAQLLEETLEAAPDAPELPPGPLRRTRRRGIFRAGGKYVVLEADDQGAKRPRVVASLTEALELREALRAARRRRGNRGDHHDQPQPFVNM